MYVYNNNDNKLSNDNSNYSNHSNTNSSNLPPLIINPPLGGKHIFYYQFRRRHDYPPHK